MNFLDDLFGFSSFDSYADSQIAAEAGGMRAAYGGEGMRNMTAEEHATHQAYVWRQFAEAMERQRNVDDAARLYRSQFVDDVYVGQVR